VLRNIEIGKLLITLAAIGLASATVACTETSSSATPPLPTDKSDGYSANPAGPNCYPDINHCASYGSGNITKADPAQPPVQK
jgi:hypothetical protein